MSDAVKSEVIGKSNSKVQLPPRDPLAHRLWQQWRSGSQPDVMAFVRDAMPLTGSQLLAILVEDQVERHRIGELVPAQRYFQSFPEIQSEPEAFNLILKEIECASGGVAAVTLDDVRQRYPKFTEQIDLLCSESSKGTDDDVDLTGTVAFEEDHPEEAKTLRLSPVWSKPLQPVEDSHVFRLYQDLPLKHCLVQPIESGSCEFKKLAHFEIQRVLARGGMGVVYLATDNRLKRPVALKMILTSANADPEAFNRFRAEAEAVARLQHAGIVQIYEVGEHEGLPYLALEYVDGQNLAQKLKNKPLPPRESARLVREIAEAVQFAHDRGIIHRDLKPANILIDATGRTKITDFGLAKLRESKESDSALVEILGTPNYMAPEQADGRVNDIGPTADVYSLGAILYELLTGQPPFQGFTPTETLLRVRLKDPVAPTHFSPKLPLDLVTICMKCLKREPHYRYESAAELGAELARFLDGKPIRSRSVTYAQQLWMWARRHPALASVIGVSIVLLVASNLAIIWQWRTAENERASSVSRNATLMRIQQDYVRESERAHSVAEERDRIELQQQLRVAELEYLTADADNAVRMLQQCPENMRGWEWRYLNRHFAGSVQTIQSDVYALDIAVANDARRILSFGSNGELQVRSVATGDVLSRKLLDRPVSSEGGFALAAFSPDCTRLAAAFVPAPNSNHPQCVAVWSVIDGALIKSWNCRDGSPVRIRFHRDGQRLAWIESAWNTKDRRLEKSSLRMVDLEKMSVSLEHTTPNAVMTDVSFSPDGKRLALTGPGKQIHIIDSDSGAAIVDRSDRNWNGSMIAWSPDGEQIAVQRGHEIVLLTSAGKTIATLSGHRGLIHSLTYSHDSRLLITGSSDHTARVWDTASFRKIDTLVGSRQPIRHASISRDQRCAVSLSSNGEIKIWDIQSGHEPLALGGDIHRDWVPEIVFHPDGKWFASVCGDRGLRIWDYRSGTLIRTIQTPRPIECCAVHPDGATIAMGLDDGHIAIVDVQTGSIHTHRAHIGSALRVQYLPTGNRLISAGEDGRVCVWDSGSFRLEKSFNGHTSAVHALAISPDQNTVATGDDTGLVRIWQLSDLKELLVIKAHPTSVSSIAFGPRGEWLATANSNRENLESPTAIHVWHTETGELLRSMVGHKLSIWRLTVSPDGTRIASAGEDWTVKVWDAQHGDLMLTLKGHTDDVRCVTFSPDGQRLASSGDNSFVLFWDAPKRNGERGLRSSWWEHLSK